MDNPSKEYLVKMADGEDQCRSVAVGPYDPPQADITKNPECQCCICQTARGLFILALVSFIVLALTGAMWFFSEWRYLNANEVSRYGDQINFNFTMPRLAPEWGNVGPGFVGIIVQPHDSRAFRRRNGT